MRLLQVSLRSLLLYSLLLVVISIPVSILSISTILKGEVDQTLILHRDQFLRHVKSFEYLDDLETDLQVLDQLTYDVIIQPTSTALTESFRTVELYDSAENETRPFRELTSLATIKGKFYSLIIRESLVGNDDLIFAIGSVQAVLIIFLVFGLILINRSLSQKLWKPFYNTLAQLKAYKIDKSESILVEKSDINEFEDLNITVSQLADRNRKVFLQQKEFIENASHELQTPLAIFQSKLDVLMQSPGLKETEAALLIELEETSQRMTRLNKNLLLLTKIDNNQFLAKEPIELSALTNSFLTNLKLTSNPEGVTIQASLATLSIEANKTLIEVLITNLLHNAIRHTNHNGEVFVQLKDRTLQVSNTGDPIKMDAKKMFERFSKESRNPTSSGLGLAIVKQICDNCQYELNYYYENHRHFFTVTF